MSISIRTLMAVLLTVASFAAAPVVFADEFPLSGTVDWVNPGASEIGIINDEEDGGTVVIIGFPIHNLEVQLEAEFGYPVTIAAGDCVAITCYEKRNGLNKWLSLTEYCVECSKLCYSDEDGLTRNPQRNSRPDPPAGPWDGNPPGSSRRP